VVAALVLAACGSTHPPVIGAAVAPPAGKRFVMAHPHGPDADDGAAKAVGWVRPAWKGGGRHPIWRGCQHVYDPALNRFINGPGLPPAESGT
jgi:hypothetical protein